MAALAFGVVKIQRISFQRFMRIVAGIAGKLSTRTNKAGTLLQTFCMRGKTKFRGIHVSYRNKYIGKIIKWHSRPEIQEILTGFRHRNSFQVALAANIKLQLYR